MEMSFKYINGKGYGDKRHDVKAFILKGFDFLDATTQAYFYKIAADINELRLYYANCYNNCDDSDFKGIEKLYDNDYINDLLWNAIYEAGWDWDEFDLIECIKSEEADNEN